MRSVYLLAEGQSEYMVIDAVLQPHLERIGFHVRKSVLVTKPATGGPARRGGVGSWARIEAEIRRILRDPTIGVVTTMIDYYGLPEDSPGMSRRSLTADPLSRVTTVERAVEEAIGDPRFTAHLVLHELEAWVLAASGPLGDLVGNRRLTEQIRKVVDGHGGPEQVNDGRDSAPSKRLLALYPAFNKVFEGPLAIADLGLDALRRQCPHADAWLLRLEALAERGEPIRGMDPE